jgi:hypothetical protein
MYFWFSFFVVLELFFLFEIILFLKTRKENDRKERSI